MLKLERKFLNKTGTAQMLLVFILCFCEVSARFDQYNTENFT